MDDLWRTVDHLLAPTPPLLFVERSPNFVVAHELRKTNKCLCGDAGANDSALLEVDDDCGLKALLNSAPRFGFVLEAAVTVDCHNVEREEEGVHLARVCMLTFARSTKPNNSSGSCNIANVCSGNHFKVSFGGKGDDGVEQDIDALSAMENVSNSFGQSFEEARAGADA